jgi:hypothetical protein
MTRRVCLDEAAQESSPMRTFAIIGWSLAGGAAAAVLWQRARRRRSPGVPIAAARARSAVALRPAPAALWIRLGATGFVAVLVPVYWRHYGPGNFLWFSDLALFALCAALWLDGPLLVGMAAVGVLALETAWSIDFLCGGRPLHFAGYMFDATQPRAPRALSLFHLAMPPAILWLLRRRGYDRRSLPRQSALASIVLPLSYSLTRPEKNVNWAFGLGARPQRALPPWLYLAGLMAALPLFVYLPTHLVLARLFRPPPGVAA